MYAADTQSKNNSCPENPPSLECFELHFNQICHSNYDLFWDTYYTYAKQAKPCNELKLTAAFLDISMYIKGNAEVSEGFHEFAEELLLSNTVCFLDAALLPSKDSLDWLIRFYVSNSLFYKDEQIQNALNEYKEEKKYQRIINLYNK